MSCCKIVKNHIDEVKRIVDKAKKNCQNIDIQKFRSIPICSIKTPDGVTPLSLNDIEKKYANDFPNWDQKFQCFPEGPIFYDSLFKKEPSTRLIDIENRKKKLKEKIGIISEVPSFTENESRKVIIERLLTPILHSLQPAIIDLSTESKVLVIKDLQQKLANGKIRGHLKVSREDKEKNEGKSEQNHFKIDTQKLQSMEVMKNLQNEAFEAVIRLFKDQPFARVKEIDKEKENLRRKISDLSKLPFDTDSGKDDEIVQKVAKYLTETLKDVIDYLHNDKQTKNDNANKITANGFLQRKFNELKQSEEKLDIIREIQNELFEKVLGNYQTLVDEQGSYKMR